MDLALDLCLALGLGLAAGIRPFLPLLVVGALGQAELGIDLDGTDVEFLQTGAALLVAVILLAVGIVLERRRGPDVLETGTLGIVSGLIAVAIGTLLAFGAVDDANPDEAWIGIPLGLAGALLALLVARQLFGRVRQRLDAEASAALPVYAEGVALVLAGLVVLAPPVALVAAGGLGWLFVQGRRKSGSRYAGLRILGDDKD